MSIFNSIDISATALSAQRLRLDTISNNIANVNTTRTSTGQPYRRQRVIFAQRGANREFGNHLTDALQGVEAQGVRVIGIEEDFSPGKLVYDPQHPDANVEGYVEMPNVNIVTEMVDMISATRSYEANIAAIDAAKSMLTRALDIGK